MATAPAGADRVAGESLVLDTADGPLDAYVARPSGSVRGAVIVAHQLFGVTSDIREFADRLAGDGYLAIAPNFYHRAGAGIALPVDDAGRAQGFELLGTLTRDGVVADFRAVTDWLSGQHQGPIAALGVSMGGHLAFLAAARLPIALTVVLYGGWLTGTELPVGGPTPTLDLAPEISGRLVYLVGDADHVVSAVDRELIGKALSDSGVGELIVLEGGVPHAYLSPGTPSYHAAAAATTWDRIAAELAGIQAAAVRRLRRPGLVSPQSARRDR
ncbi:dienelactone hydrolase family protein [Nocardia stercoris]|uniref:Dienelactone hydrolase family protein n=2 Tax=Nocardia stercoris TaxID=2483361 RepID=A0A3M2LM84_9NOCA|nr:dienelactone hydrolase family protein [Nocardia stercoris]